MVDLSRDNMKQLRTTSHDMPGESRWNTSIILSATSRTTRINIVFNGATNTITVCRTGTANQTGHPWYISYT